MRNYIIPNKLYKGKFLIYIYRDITLLIKYHGKEYQVSVIEEDSQFYWHLIPYKFSYYTTNIDNYSSFDRGLFAIKENDKVSQ